MIARQYMAIMKLGFMPAKLRKLETVSLRTAPAAMSTATNDKLRLVNGTTANGHWSITEANEHYDIGRWGQGYFSVGEAGHVLVHPTKDATRSVDLKKLVDRLEMRGLSAPMATA